MAKVRMQVDAAALVNPARIRAHEVFDELWKSGLMSRKAAYAWLARAMELPPGRAHIAQFNVEQCERVVELVGKLYLRPGLDIDLGGDEAFDRAEHQEGWACDECEWRGCLGSVRFAGCLEPEGCLCWCHR